MHNVDYCCVSCAQFDYYFFYFFSLASSFISYAKKRYGKSKLI